MKKQLKNQDVDFAIFTGDLVDKYSAKLSDGLEYLVETLKESGIDTVYLSCGNHDIDRDAIPPMFSSYIDSLSTSQEISKFVLENKANQFSDQLKHVEEYLKISDNHTNIVEKSELYTIYQHKIACGRNVSIVSLNLAWCAFHRENYGKLVYPSALLTAISKKMNKNDFNICISHFDSKFLKSHHQKDFTKVLYNTFDAFFVGHSHENNENSVEQIEGGMFTSTAAMLKYDNNSMEMGFKILDFNLDEYLVDVNHYLIENGVLTNDKRSYQIPADHLKKIQIKLKSRVDAKYEEIVRKSDKKFLMGRDESDVSFSELYVMPELRDTSYSDLQVTNTKVHKTISFKLDELFNETNYIVYGNDKSGKSALLYKVYIELLDNFDYYRILPVFINFRDGMDSGDFNVKRLLHDQYSLSNRDVEMLSSEFHIKVLVDNIHLASSISESIKKFCSNRKEDYSHSFIITANKKIDSDFSNLGELHSFKRLFIHSLSRSTIRELTSKWPLKCEQTEAMEKITKLLSTMNIGFNFWTVSMFLFVLEKTEDFRFRNNAELIELYIEKLLDKETLIVKGSKISYESLKIYLANLAYYLVENRDKGSYYCSYMDLISCYEEIQKRNLRLVAESKEVIDYLIEHQVIVKLNPNKYSFRMNGIFEYFLSYYMLRNDDFKNSILENESKYQAFRNEIELYSGMMKNDNDLLETIYLNLLDLKTRVMNQFDFTYEYEKLADSQNEKVKKIMDVASYFKDSIQPIPVEEIDLMDDSAHPLKDVQTEITVKELHVIEEYSDYIDCVSILGRAFRNMDDIDDKNLIQKIFRFLLDESCLSVYYIVGDFLKENSSYELTEKDIKEFEKFLISFAPLLAQSVLFEMISHPTIENLIELEIDDLLHDKQNNQVKLFVLYFLLAETNLNEKMARIEELIEIATVWNVQNSIFFKLLTIVAFKSNGNDALVKNLKKHLNHLYKKMYPDSKGINVNKIVNDLKFKGKTDLPKNNFFY